MHRVRLNHVTLEFDKDGHHYRAEPFDLIASEVPGPGQSQPPSPTENQSRYALRKGLGLWRLTFEGQDATLKHERGIFYVAWLLEHPEQTPIHALDLIAKIPEMYRRQLGLADLTLLAEECAGCLGVVEGEAAFLKAGVGLG